MNIALILSSGVGSRFGSDIPKQYLKILGKEAISYVIDAAKGAKTVDKIIIVAHEPFKTRLNAEYGLEVVEGGDTRNRSFRNGVDYIKAKGYDCENLIVLDAVRPFVTSEIIDSYLNRMNEYNICVTAKKITDSLCCFDTHTCDRERFYMTSSPMSFKFNELDKYLQADSQLIEVMQMYPEDIKVYLNYDFKNNYKLTYAEDLDFIETYITVKNKRK